MTAPHVAESMQDAVYDRSRTLAIVVGGADRAERLAEYGIEALVYDAICGDPPAFVGIGGARHDTPTAPLREYDGNDSLDHTLYGYGLDRRRVVIVAPSYVGPRDRNPADRLAALLRDEGARVTVVQDSGDVADAIRNATSFGAFTRTLTAGSKPEPLIDGVLYKAQNHSIFGAYGTGKTMLALHYCAMLVKRGEHVVYLDRENGAGRIFERMRMLGCSEDHLQRFFRYFAEPDTTFDNAPDFRDMLEELRPALVVFDSFLGFLSAAGVDENSATGVASWFAAYAPPTLEAATLILDHTPKNDGGTARGSGRKGDAVDVMWHMAGRFSQEHPGAVRLTLKKARDGGLPDKVSYTMGGSPFRVLDGSATKLKPEDRTLAALEDGFTAGEWLDASGLAERTFYRHRVALENAGRVERCGDGYCHVAAAE